MTVTPCTHKRTSCSCLFESEFVSKTTSNMHHYPKWGGIAAIGRYCEFILMHWYGPYIRGLILQILCVTVVSPTEIDYPSPKLGDSLSSGTYHSNLCVSLFSKSDIFNSIESNLIIFPKNGNLHNFLHNLPPPMKYIPFLTTIWSWHTVHSERPWRSLKIAKSTIQKACAHISFVFPFLAQDKGV